MTRRVLALSLLIALSHSPELEAQMRSGDTLRVYQCGGIVSEGILVTADSAAVVLRTAEPPASLRIARRDIVSLERREGTREIGRVAVIAGVVVGTVAGVQIGAATRAKDERSGGLLIPSFPYRSVGALLGALSGALVGALIGKVHYDHWKPLSIGAVWYP